MRRAYVALGVVAAALVVGGCDYRGAQSLPLPGGVSEDEAYRVSVVLPDATNLVPRETCRTNDTVVGSVESVTLDDDLNAVVVCLIKDSVDLPANLQASLRETSLLGERYVALDSPAGTEPKGTLEPGSVVPASSTRVDPNVEMVLGALSQLLNGGSLGSIETISRELTIALEESDVGATTRTVARVVAELNEHRSDITATLEAMDRFSGRLARQRGVLAEALRSIPDGLAVLDRQRPALVGTLRRLSELSSVAVPLIDQSREDVAADLRLLAPVLAKLTKQGREISATLERVVTFPFASNSMSVIRGDYAGFYGSIAFDIDALNELLGGALPAPTADQPAGADDPTGPAGPTGLSPVDELLDDLLGNLLGSRTADDGGLLRGQR